jgi:multiple sugar transport system substrate-binding protein
MLNSLVLRLVFCVLLTVAMLAGTPAWAKTVLTVAGHWSGDQLAWFKENADEYMRLHPDITIEFVFAPTDTPEGVLKVLLLTGGKGDVVPDIVHMFLAVAADFLRADGAVPMPPQLMQEARRFFFAPTLESLTIDGKLYGFPTELVNHAVIYHSRMLQDAGMSHAPTTWDELKAAARKLTQVNPDGTVKRYGFNLRRGGPHFAFQFLNFLWSNGGTDIDAHGNVRIVSQEAQETLSLFHEMFTQGLMNYGWLIHPDSFAMVFQAPTDRTGLINTFGYDDFQENVISALVPHGKSGPASYQYGWGIFVTATSKNSDEAWKFLRWLTMDTRNRITPMGNHMAKLGTMPTNQVDLNARRDMFKEPFYNAFLLALEKYGRTEPMYPKIGERQSAIDKALVPAVEGTKPILAALEEAHQQISILLADK